MCTTAKRFKMGQPYQPNSSGRVGMGVLIHQARKVSNPGAIMPTVKVSAEFQIVIPADIRERIHLAPGQELKVNLHGDHILLVPVRPSAPMRLVSELHDNLVAL